MDLYELETLKKLLRKFQNTVTDTDLLDVDQLQALTMTRDSVDIVLEFEQVMGGDE